MKYQARIPREKPEIWANIGNLDILRQNIINAQRGSNPKEPDNLSELNNERERAETFTGQWFLLHDSGKDSCHAATLCASTEELRHLAMKAEWYMDVNINTTPKLLQKIYVIHAKLGQSAVTRACALITRKSQDLYVMLQAISRVSHTGS